MSDAVVCKFWCNVKKAIPHANPPETPHMRLEFGAVWEGTQEKQAASENAKFGKWTPDGHITIALANPEAADFFEPGQHYYVTFTKADGRFNVGPM